MVPAMSSIWTPGGEHPVGDDERRRPPAPPGTPGPGAEPTPEEAARYVAELEAQLLQTPVAVIIRDHAATFFQLARLHLEQPEPDLAQARLAIDAMAALIEGVGDRLPDGQTLTDALAQLRLAFVQIHGAHAAGEGDEPAAG